MSLLDALQDEDFRSDVGRGLLDVGNRGFVAGLLGAPVDVATMALRPLGYRNQAPVGGSEWIGQGMENLGMVSPERRPLAEMLSSLIPPGGAAKLPALALAMSPAGKARLLADLQAGKAGGAYRLGGVTEGQGKGLDALFGRPSPSRDVIMSDDTTRHLVQKRLNGEGYTPEEITRFAEEAMARRARPDLDPSKQAQHPSLLAPQQLDPATGRRYEARMPLAQTDDGLEVRSVVPDGLPPRKKKTPRP